MSKKKEKKSWWYVFRDAATGLFVKKEYAEKNPTTTVREKVTPKK